MLDERPDATSTSAALSHVTDACGPQLSLVLIQGIGGGAARSELDGLTEPLRKLAFRGGAAKAWLEDALASDQFPSDRVLEADKRTFLQTILR